MKLIEELTDELVDFLTSFLRESSVIRSSDLTVSEPMPGGIRAAREDEYEEPGRKIRLLPVPPTVTVDRLERKEYAVRESIKEDRRLI